MSYGLRVDYRKNLLPYQISSTFDTMPDQTSIGVRVWCLGEGKQWYGRITGISGRYCTVQLEKRWAGKTRITIHWESLRIAEDQNTPPPRRKGIDPKRIAELQEAVETMMSRPPPPSEEEQAAIVLLRQEHDDILEDIKMLEELHDQVSTLVDNYERRRIDGHPPGIDMPFTKRARRKTDVRSHLKDVRGETRQVLSCLLKAAGEQGVSSEEVTAVLCTEQITSHRIMGMLSALSRRGEAELGPTGKWHATAILSGKD